MQIPGLRKFLESVIYYSVLDLSPQQDNTEWECNSTQSMCFCEVVIVCRQLPRIPDATRQSNSIVGNTGTTRRSPVYAEPSLGAVVHVLGASFDRGKLLFVH